MAASLPKTVLFSATRRAMIAYGTGAVSKVMQVTVSYRERIALPPDAELEVQLLDVSKARSACRSRRPCHRYVPDGHRRGTHVPRQHSRDSLR
jgi:hypothetical protein